jgi:hypothetical protein
VPSCELSVNSGAALPTAGADPAKAAIVNDRKIAQNVIVVKIFMKYSPGPDGPAVFQPLVEPQKRQDAENLFPRSQLLFIYIA